MPVLQRNDDMNNTLLQTKVQDIKPAPQALCTIHQDVTSQMQPQTTAKVGFPTIWEKILGWAGSQKQGIP